MRYPILSYFANRNAYWFWLPILLGHLLAWSYQVTHERWALVDSKEYLWAAHNMWSSGILYSHDLNEDLQPWHYTKRPPVYPLMLIFTGALEGHYLLVGLAQMIMSLLSIYLTLRVIHELGLPQRSLFVSLFFVLLYPAQIIYANLLMTEMLLQVLITVMTLALLKAFRLKIDAYLWIACAAFCLSLLTKPVMYLYTLPFIGIMAYMAWQQKRSWILGLGLIPICLVIGYSQWNGLRTGYVHVSSIQQINLLQYNAFTLLNQTVGPQQADSIVMSIRAASLAQGDFAAAQQYTQAQSIDIILQNMPTYLRIQVQGMFNFFVDPGRFDVYHFFGLQSTGAGPGLLKAFREGGYQGIWTYLQHQPIGWVLLLLSVAAVNTFKLLCLGIFVFSSLFPWQKRWLVLLPILYLAGVSGPIGTSRFAVPIFPLMVAIATAVVWPKLRKWGIWAH